MNNYYEKNAKEYIENTINCDMSYHYDKFLKYLPKNGKILDVGFGSGRDIRHFMELGYDVTGIDVTPIFVQLGEQAGYHVLNKSVEDIEYENEFDGIWACASLLHINRNKLEEVIKKCIKALKKDGIMYCSFKYGDKEIVKDERYFNYVDETIIEKIINDNNLLIVEMYKTFDVRKERNSEEWINILFKK